MSDLGHSGKGKERGKRFYRQTAVEQAEHHVIMMIKERSFGTLEVNDL